MLYFASLICPSHEEKNQFFDENTKKPCLGKCGHTICLYCVEMFVNCPICNHKDAFIDRTINYGAMKIIKDCRSNILNMFKSCWAGEKYGSGLCSECFTQTESLRICLLCDSHLGSIDVDGVIKLDSMFREYLLELYQWVVCADCALEHHDHPEQENFKAIVKIEKIKVDRHARIITCEKIFDLLNDEVKNGNLQVNCKLRFMKLRKAKLVLSTDVEEPNGFEEGDCGYLGELIRNQMENKYVKNTLTEIDQAFNGPVCECTRLYDELLKVTEKWDAKFMYRQMSMTEVNELAIGCSLNSRNNSRWRDSIYSNLRETPPNIEYTKLINTEGGCQLCIYHEEYLDEELKQQKTEYYRDHYMEIYENFWRSEMPSIEALCFRCLSYLQCNLVGHCCKKVNKQWPLNRADLNEEELIEHQRRFGVRQMDSNNCKHGGECILRDKNFWKYAVKLEIKKKAYKIFKDQIEGWISDDQTCSNVLETLKKMDHCIGDINLQEDTKEELLGKVAMIDEILEELKTSYSRLRLELLDAASPHKIWVGPRKRRGMDASRASLILMDILRTVSFIRLRRGRRIFSEIRGNDQNWTGR